jgi:RimJ/RimL family protein N-acetyltransferase
MTLPDLSIRELGTADLDAYKALRDHALAHHEEAFTSDAATETQRSAASYASRLGGGSDGSFTLGAFRADALVGAISLERDPRSKVRHVGHVIGTMVQASELRRGVGGALLDALIARAAADAELHQLTLTVTAGNEAAEHLYARAGFARYGTLQRAIQVGGRFFDKHHMVLALR